MNSIISNKKTIDTSVEKTAGHTLRSPAEKPQKPNENFFVNRWYRYRIDLVLSTPMNFF
jgi:hypothetical protein